MSQPSSQQQSLFNGDHASRQLTFRLALIRNAEGCAEDKFFSQTTGWQTAKTTEKMPYRQ
jgi:hypothetical protein